VTPLPRRRMGRRSPSRSISRSGSQSRSPASPPRRRNLSKDRRGKGMRYSRSLSSSRSRHDNDKMDVDGGAKGGLKIKGQAEIQKRKSKWEGVHDAPSRRSPANERSDLEKRENELKEKALRNKVVRTRKGSSGMP